MMEIGRITIVKCLADDGHSEVIRTIYSDGLTLIDALGMMEFARIFTPDFFDHEEPD